jgi:hypothetical protein
MDDYGQHAIDRVNITHQLGEFTYHSWGNFEFKGHTYDRHVADYLPPIEPLKTKRGAIAKRQPEKPQSKPAMWWKAQCVFRGLHSKGPLADYQNTLRGHENDPISHEILQLQKAAREKFEAKDAEEKNQCWLHKWTDEEKAYKDPERYLREKFKPGDSSKETIQLRANSTIWLHQVAKELGLECRTTNEPKDLSSIWSPSSYLAIIGQDKATVEERVRVIKKEAERIDVEIQKEKNREEKKARELERQKAKDREAALAKCNDWDVTGTWEINIPYIMEQYGEENDRLSLEIYIKDTTKGPQMFALFNFAVLEGVMRFERQVSEKPNSTSKAITSSGPLVGRKRRREESYDEDDEDSEGRRSPTPEAFYLGPTKQPSAKHQEWNYRYRAREVEGPIALDEDKNLYQITFLGPKGRTLKGSIGADLFKKCDFTGVKIAPSGKKSVDVSEVWANYNETAYNSAHW